MAEQHPNRRDVLRAGAAALPAALIGCQGQPDAAPPRAAPRTANHARIQAALAALLERHNEDSFVIFEEKASAKFVQFARAQHGSLLLDLPSQTLNAAETARAQAFFLDLGVRATVEAALDRPGGRVVGRQRAFQMRFGQDVGRAADVTAAVFDRVYRFPLDFELVVTEN
jgi:hypothetical protein